MLRLMNIEEIRTHVYQVTLDRDGATLQYEFIYRPPREPDGIPNLDAGERIDWDLIDYEKRFPGPSQGMIWVPVVSDICRLVYRVTDGERLTFPIVLDER